MKRFEINLSDRSKEILIRENKLKNCKNLAFTSILLNIALVLAWAFEIHKLVIK